MNQREYRTALRGNSKKLKLTNAIDYTVAKSRTKQQFIEQLQKLGYGVKWVDHYKYITYTTPDGQRFRDNRLPDDKYLKTNMEELFAYGYEKFKTNQPNTTGNAGHGEKLDRADSTDVFDAQAGTLQSAGTTHLVDWERHCAEYGFDIRVADTGRIGQSDRGNDPTEFDQDAANRRGEDGLDQIFRRGQVVETDGEFGEATAYGHLSDDERAEGERLDAVEAETEMGGSWGDIAVSSLYLAADLAMIGGSDNEKSKPKYVRERKHGQKKKKQDEQSQDNGYELKM